MAEEVQTGGLVKFKYGKSDKGKISEDLKREIKGGYARYYERKEREIRNKKILLIIIGLILLILFGLALWRLF